MIDNLEKFLQPRYTSWSTSCINLVNLDVSVSNFLLSYFLQICRHHEGFLQQIIQIIMHPEFLSFIITYLL